MPKALILTVGGSDEPLVEAIKTLKPDFIYFICSGGEVRVSSCKTVDGEGKVCCDKDGKPVRESIIKQSAYTKGYEKIKIEDPDNFDEVYKKTSETISKAKEKGHEIIADFTGGTKTMTAVLAMLSALDPEIKPYLTKGRRKDLIRTEGISGPNLVNTDSAYAENIFKFIDILISNYLYSAAVSLLRELGTHIRDSEINKKIQKRKEICIGFEKWDKFHYKDAFDILKIYRAELKEVNYLAKLAELEKRTGYEPVFDLVSNAERQASNGFYDNAVARLYRALELFAQIRLVQQYGIRTSNVELEKLSEEKREKWKKEPKDDEGKIKIGLIKSWELLLDLDDKAGNVYENYRREFLDIIRNRNNSKLAHGNDPVTEQQYNKFHKFCKEFFELCAKNINIKIEYVQFPKKF